MKLENKISIITGAGSGIGRAIAIKFAEEGSDIVIVYSRNDANANETARKIQEIGRDTVFHLCDLSPCKQQSEVDTLFLALTERVVGKRVTVS